MDIFISYTHVDNLPLKSGQRGWVDDFHRALQIRVLQWLGRSEHELEVWRDPKLTGNDDFSAEIFAQLRKVRVLVSVLSPRYLNSGWCRDELEAFYRAAEETGGIVAAGNKARVFKVVKMPVPQDKLPSPLQPLLGYDFFRTDPESGRPRELHEMFGDDAGTAFWLRLDDLAYDIADLLNKQAAPGLDEDAPVVYLAAGTHDISEEHAALRRELERTGHRVVPRGPLPLVASEMEAQVREHMASARLAVIPVGSTYGLVPEGETRSIVEIQNALAAQRSRSSEMDRLIWILPGADPADPRQVGFLQRLRSGEDLDARTDLLEARLEELKAVVHHRLTALKRPPPPPAAPPGTSTVYLICDPPELEAVDPLVEHLFGEGLEVVLPVFEGDEAELREEHEERLRTCDAVLIYYGGGTDLWLSRKLRELQKIWGQGRTAPMLAQAIFVGPPASPAKERLRTHGALVIRQDGDFDPRDLAPFVAQIRAGGSE